jgi:Rieske Fe-S protein
MAEESQQDERASRRGVLLGVGLAGIGCALAGCSTAAVPYDANEAGVAPGSAVVPAAAAPMNAAAAPMGAHPASAGGANAGGANAGGGMMSGTLLGLVKDIPVGGGKVFMSQKVVVTQPARGVFKAFSAICTHVGCVCNVVSNGTINCPCHGSEFKISDGAVVTGPAPAPLPARTIAVSDGKILLQ